MIDTALIRKYQWKIQAALLLAVLLIFLAVRWWRGPEVLFDKVVRRDFVQSVVATGHVETPHRIDVGVQITGTVIRIPVNEGQNVKLGDVLIELDPAELRASEQQAGIAVSQAQQRVRQLREVQAPVAEQALRQAQANLKNAQTVLRRNENLFQKGFISAAALDDFRKAVELADAQVQSTRKQLATTQPNGSDFALAEGAVSEAGASAKAASARARYTVVKAAMDGTLIGRNVEVGDVVQAGKVLMTLSPVGITQLIVEIDEKNLRLLALGQNALVAADAYPQQRFAARLAYINPGVNAQTGAVSVKFDVAKPPAMLKQDMTVSVDTEVARRPNALLVPASAVHDADGAAPWVLLEKNGRLARRPLQLGLRSGGFAEVIDGLSEGDLLLPATETLTAGARVRAAKPTAAP